MSLLDEFLQILAVIYALIIQVAGKEKKEHCVPPPPCWTYNGHHRITEIKPSLLPFLRLYKFASVATESKYIRKPIK